MGWWAAGGQSERRWVRLEVGRKYQMKMVGDGEHIFRVRKIRARQDNGAKLC